MTEKRDNSSRDEDAELEREIRSDRKFSLSEAIGRMAGPGMMKGVSPVTRKHQAEAAIEYFLHRNLNETGGVLGTVLLRRVGESDLLIAAYDQPLTALANYLGQIVDSDYLLKALVRETDAEWGRVFGERPHFDRPGCPADPDDPYTSESVRTALSRLMDALAAHRA